MSKKVVREPARKKGKKEIVEVTGAAVKAKNGSSQHNNSTIRNMFSSLLKSHSELSLVENAWGALQVKRAGDVLFSARRDGKMIISHPMFEGSGKGRKRIFKHGGGHYDHLSHVPFESVTKAMLEARIKDTKTSKEYHDEIYKGREAESGLRMRAARVAAKVGEAGKETTKKVSKKVAALSAKREAKESKRKKTPALAKAMAKVAAENASA